VSLVSVIVTSSAAAGVYLERHVANLRLGMTLELFTASGALVGGLIAFAISERVLALLFAALLTYVAVTMLRGRARAKAAPAATAGAAAAAPLAASADPAPAAPATATVAPRTTVIDALSGPGYRVHGLRTGVIGATFAGVVSALLGVGGGIVKVPLMNLGMGVPMRVATATSNLMIGITAAASATIYLLRGGIDAYVAGPTAIGVFAGAVVGSRVAHRVDLNLLRILFVIVLVYTAVQMLLRGLR
jgi:uncharacterized protein